MLSFPFPFPNSFKINITRQGDLAVALVDLKRDKLIFSVVSQSTTKQFSVETHWLGFGYEHRNFSPSEFYFCIKYKWRKKIHESNQRIAKSFREKGFLSPETEDLLNLWNPDKTNR